MHPWIAALIVVIGSVPSAVEQDGVKVSVSIKSHVYTWAVTNNTDRPITRFEVDQHRCYNQQVPKGWTFELKRPRFRAWVEDPGKGILPFQTKQFTARTSSRGAVLGTVPLSVGLGLGGEQTITIQEVWGPVPKPGAQIALIALTIAAITVFHAVIVTRRERRKF